MGWTKYKAGDDALRYEVPAITLEALASQLKKTLGTRGGIRAIGDRTMTVRKIGLLPGYTMIQASIAMMPGVDVIVTGEVQEWESATYAQDVAFAGVKKGFISIGRVVNEAPGMQVCADWLKTIVPEVPVRFIRRAIRTGGRAPSMAASELTARRGRQPDQGRDGRAGCLRGATRSTRDRFKFGGPDTVVTGIATTFMGTFEAITRASERGLNMIIPHEDTYWNDPDNTVIAEADTARLQEEGRLHDGAQHRRVPDPRSHAPATA